MVISVQDDYYHCQLMVQVFAEMLAVAVEASPYSQFPVMNHRLILQAGYSEHRHQLLSPEQSESFH